MTKDKYIQLFNSDNYMEIIYQYFLDKGGSRMSINMFRNILTAWSGFNSIKPIIEICVDYYDKMYHIVKFEYKGETIIIN